MFLIASILIFNSSLCYESASNIDSTYLNSYRANSFNIEKSALEDKFYSGNLQLINENLNSNQQGFSIPEIQQMEIKSDKNINNILSPVYRTVAQYSNLEGKISSTHRDDSINYTPPIKTLRANSWSQVQPFYKKSFTAYGNKPDKSNDQTVTFPRDCPCEITFKCPPCGRVFIEKPEFSCPCAMKKCSVCPPLSLIHQLAFKKAINDRRQITSMRYNARSIDQALKNVEKFADRVIQYERQSLNSAKSMEESSLKSQIAKKNMYKNSEKAKMVARNAIMSEIQTSRNDINPENMYNSNIENPLPEPGPFETTNLFPIMDQDNNKEHLPSSTEEQETLKKEVQHLRSKLSNRIQKGHRSAK